MQANLRPTTTKDKAFAKVALPVPVEASFTYIVPDDLQDGIFVGCRVEVPFGRRVLSGIVVDLCNTTDIRKTKPIRSLHETYLPPDLIKVAEWIASYYGCTLGEAAQSVLPPSLRSARRQQRLRGIVRIVEADAGALREKLKRARRQLELVEAVRKASGGVSVETVVRDWGFDRAQVKALVEKGIVVIESHPQAFPTSTLDALDAKVTQLTADQEVALERISARLEGHEFSPFLLYGVTGSGKTELYLRAARAVLSTGGGCIVLVPEISLIPQAVARYRRIFGDQIAILHSRLTGPERYEIWRRVETGECRLVLGPRSAVFSPVKNLRLIVVDEEQDDSYKQEEKPRYHARSVALMRGKFEKLTVVLGSATPSAESYHQARSDRYNMLTLPTRVRGTPLPVIRLVDLRSTPMQGAFFSATLLERLEWNVRNGNQSILFLNKRGHARFVLCNACGHVEECDNCDISLIYHRVTNTLRCHFCGYRRAAAQRCRSCGSPKLYFSGAGTQRVELDLASLLPGVGILRMDADTTSGKEGHRRILEQFGTGDYPILIGTQMVTKGHHFPRVNLVGVLLAEDSLNYPDFRSAERTFQQLTQVAGRAGRADATGEVLVQTFQPDHDVFRFVQAHDYTGFMEQELKVRKQLGYPPFSRLILGVCSAPAPRLLDLVVRRWTHAIRRFLRGRPAEVLGPVPPIVPRVRNRYREHVLIKGNLTTDEKTALHRQFRRVAEGVRGGSTVELRWDVDPESFL